MGVHAAAAVKGSNSSEQELAVGEVPGGGSFDQFLCVQCVATHPALAYANGCGCSV